MLIAAIVFFIMGLVSILLGALGLGISIEVGKAILFIFLVMAVISFIASLVVGRRIIK